MAPGEEEEAGKEGDRPGTPARRAASWGGNLAAKVCGSICFLRDWIPAPSDELLFIPVNPEAVSRLLSSSRPGEKGDPIGDNCPGESIIPVIGVTGPDLDPEPDRLGGMTGGRDIEENEGGRDLILCP